MKRKIIVILITSILLSNIAYGADYSRVQRLGLIGQGEARWDSKITREEIATIAVRLTGRESEISFYKDKNTFKDVSGWSKGYVNLANEIGIMGGTGKSTFKPKANITYVELLTVIMRALGYEDKIDFVVFPQDYYHKALEIGLGNVHIEKEKVITRGIVAETLERGLDLKLKNQDRILLDKMTWGYPGTGVNVEDIILEPEERGAVEIVNVKFNTSIAALFSGQLKGRADFTGHTIILSTNNGNYQQTYNLGKDGKFEMKNFDIDMLTKLGGYKVKITDPVGRTIHEEDLK